jgi:hypothetical protein
LKLARQPVSNRPLGGKLSPRVVPLAKGAANVQLGLFAVLSLLLKLTLKLRESANKVD